MPIAIVIFLPTYLVLAIGRPLAHGAQLRFVGAEAIGCQLRLRVGCFGDTSGVPPIR
ncbi:MAG: hypothetical protein ABSF64_15520 [Bryobacteraceae bacterium]